MFEHPCPSTECTCFDEPLAAAPAARLVQSALETISKMEQQKAAAAAAAGAAGGSGGATEQAGFDRPAGGSGSAAGAGAAAAPAPVKDLGVVGRGTKRLNLAPVQVGFLGGGGRGGGAVRANTANGEPAHGG